MMSVLYEPHEMCEASTRSLVAAMVVMIGSALGFTLLTAPSRSCSFSSTSRATR
jgi:hypothetical protein